MGFSRQEYLNGLPFPSPGDLPDAGIKPRSPASQADSLLSELSIQDLTPRGCSLQTNPREMALEEIRQCSASSVSPQGCGGTCRAGVVAARAQESRVVHLQLLMTPSRKLEQVQGTARG